MHFVSSLDWSNLALDASLKQLFSAVSSPSNDVSNLASSLERNNYSSPTSAKHYITSRLVARRSTKPPHHALGHKSQDRIYAIELLAKTRVLHIYLLYNLFMQLHSLVVSKLKFKQPTNLKDSRSRLVFYRTNLKI